MALDADLTARNAASKPFLPASPHFSSSCAPFLDITRSGAHSSFSAFHLGPSCVGQVFFSASRKLEGLKLAGKYTPPPFGGVGMEYLIEDIFTFLDLLLDFFVFFPMASSHLVDISRGV
jgi:hypothetical protein